MENFKERAEKNELNCKAGAMQILYSLAQWGLLAPPYVNWALGAVPTEGKELEAYNKAIADISESILGFNDDIKEEGEILGEL